MKKLMIVLLMVVATSTASFAKGSNEYDCQARCCQERCVQGEDLTWYVQHKHAQGHRNKAVSRQSLHEATLLSVAMWALVFLIH